MIGRLIKKKLDANKLANVFVNSLLEITENGFEDVKSMISDDTAFVSYPQLASNAEDKFLLIVIVGNLRYLDSHFEVVEAKEIHTQIVRKFAAVFSMEEAAFEKIIQEYDLTFLRVSVYQYHAFVH